jgi:uncharacterized protein (TIGR02757 family)
MPALLPFCAAAGHRITGTWKSNLFPDPERGSAAKRVFLYLRWMIRKDAVDPGPWTRVSPAGLVIPLDTHMAAACRCLGLLGRTQTDLRAAREATAAFRAILPEDPVRYDFCMTRPGIHPDLDPAVCFERPDLTSTPGTDPALSLAFQCIAKTYC